MTNSQSAASKSEAQLKEKVLQLQEQLQTKIEELRKKEASIDDVRRESSKPNMQAAQATEALRAEMERLAKEKREAWGESDHLRAQVCMCVYLCM